MRDVRQLQVVRGGRVEETGDRTLPWMVRGRDDADSVNEYLRALMGDGNRPTTCRSYAYDLLRWLRFLEAVGAVPAMARPHRKGRSQRPRSPAR